MKQSLLLAHRFREVIFDGTFIANTNYKQQLSNLSWQEAERRYGTLNPVAALAQHIHYYIAGVNAVLLGGELTISDKFSFDFTPFVAQEDWDMFLQRFWKDAELFAVLVAELTDEQLMSDFVDQKYGNYLRNIDAMIEHCYYHLGQIVLLSRPSKSLV